MPILDITSLLHLPLLNANLQDKQIFFSISVSLLIDYTCAVSRLERDVLLYSLTAPCLLLAKVEYSNELVESSEFAKVVEVF